MNKKLYIGIYIGSFAVFLLIGVPALLLLIFENYSMQLIRSLGMQVRQGMPLIFVAIAISFLQLALVHIILNLVMLAKMWGTIQDGQTQITVGKAIGLLFIPVFSFFWLAFAWGRFPIEYNNFIDRQKLNVPRSSRFIFISYALLQQIGIIFFLPWLWIVFAGALGSSLGRLITGVLSIPFLLLPIIFAVLILQICSLVNGLQEVGVGRKQMSPSSSQLQQTVGFQPNQME